MFTQGFSLVLVLVFLCTGLGWAQESEKPRSRLKIKSSVSAATRYESNFFLTNDNERGIFTYFIAPHVGVAYETPRFNVNLDVTLEAVAYSDAGDPPPEKRKASDLNYLAPLVALSTTYDLTKRLKISLFENFYVSRYPQNFDRLSNSTDRGKYWTNRLAPRISYEFRNRFELDFRYIWQVINYIESDPNDSVENKFFVDLLYNAQRTLTVGLDYQFWIIDYSDSPSSPFDTRTHELFLMGQKRYKYTTFEGRVGYATRKYQEFAEIGEISRNAYVFKASVSAENPPPPDVRRSIGQANERAKSHIYLAADRNFNSIGDSFISNRLTLSVGHVWLRKLFTVVRGYYQIADYDYEFGLTPDGNIAVRDDDLYNISGRIGYLITKSMEVSITVGKQNRSSNLAGLDYDDKFAYLRFSFGFDLRSRGGFSEEAAYY